MRSFSFLGLVTLAAALHAQPTTGAQYWSTTPPDCSSLNESPVVIKNAAGATVGYSCWVSGTFAWLAAGSGWGSSIRVSAPSSGAVGVDYSFYDTSGNNLTLDTSMGSGSPASAGNDVNFALYANQPAEVDLLGVAGGAPSYSALSTGSVYAVFYCPDAATCGTVLPQLLYSFLPTKPWLLSVPISWDTAIWTQWSAAGIDDGGTRLVSLVVYNQNSVATVFTIRVYDGTGALTGTGTTPAIAGFGTYGDLLSHIVKTSLPQGVFKVLIDGGSNSSSVLVLQFLGNSASSLQVAYDYPPSASSRAQPALRSNVRRDRIANTPKSIFNTLMR